MKTPVNATSLCELSACRCARHLEVHLRITYLERTSAGKVQPTRDHRHGVAAPEQSFVGGSSNDGHDCELEVKCPRPGGRVGCSTGSPREKMGPTPRLSARSSTSGCWLPGKCNQYPSGSGTAGSNTIPMTQYKPSSKTAEEPVVWSSTRADARVSSVIPVVRPRSWTRNPAPIAPKASRPVQLPFGDTSNESASCHSTDTVWSTAELAGGELGRRRGPVNG